MTDDIVDAVIAEELPLAESLSGHCQDAKQAPEWGYDADEVQRLHLACPATFWPTTWPDPARKGATYTTPGRRCPCVCHTRPATMTPGATKGA